MDKSLCKKNIYCDFDTVFNNEEILKEVCTNCGKHVYYNKVGGGIDDKQYMRDHRRDWTQPFTKEHGNYLKMFGTAGIDAMQEAGQMKYRKQQAELEVKELLAEDRKQQGL